ncbi:uncharacterized protein PG998_012627 [Apiospora kogelbergensis]|uniref:Elongator complex protein 6 n=1 Tax=Apiospora kogelbergensis TaxID=1337665 RepID=A0AAW0QPD8_9PEZI
MASRTPPLLEPYLGLPPEASLIVLTGVLGASTNWLVQRYLCRFLATTAADRNAQRTAVGEEGDSSNPDDGDSASVVLVSFLRDYAFWKEGAGRIGVDLDASSKKGKFVFVDGLSKLFSGGPSAHGVSSPADASGKVLSNSTLHELRKQLAEAVTQLRQQSQSSKIVLILDSPDLLLAATGKTMTGAALQDLLLDIREEVHSSIVTLAADEPLLSAQTTTLEKEHAAFAISFAHAADMIISLRMLDTGTAKDVSGVLRVTQRSASANAGEDRELLYFIAGDGGVRVFERGQ